MKITKDNIENIPIKERALVKALLDDLEEINEFNYRKDREILYLEWIDEHTEYSPERTDPCPDFYGMYRVWRGDDYIGVEMDLDTLDSALCLLYNFVIEILEMNKEEYLNSLSKEDILNGIGWYLLNHNDIPEDVSPEDIWSVIADLLILECF